MLLACLALLLFGGALPRSRSVVASAQGDLPDSYQATLTQVRALISAPEALQVQRTPDGGFFVDLQGSRQFLLLTRTDAQGRLITRCVGSVEEAAAFLSGDTPLLAEPLSAAEAAIHQIIERTPVQRRAALAASQTQISINVKDLAGEGFNDPTPATPVGGNTGTTIGEQRLIAFTYAASIWADYLQSTVPIIIDAGFDPLDCNVLGAAGPQVLYSNFTPSGYNPGPEYANTLYVEALANKRAGHDLGPSSSDIGATFNSAFGTSGCGGGGWYYGLDHQESDTEADLVAVLLHEIGHGLGFISLVSTSANTYGMNFPYYTNPAKNQDDIWNYFLYDNNIGKLFKDMTVAERARAITDTKALVWSGPAVTAAARNFLQASPVLTITTPPAVSGRYELGLASFGTPVQNPPLVGTLVAAIDPDTDGAGTADTIFDACSPISNVAALTGKIALIDRGTCAFTDKVRHAQEAGAVAAIIANNQSGDPPQMIGSDATISIPAVSITQANGATLRAALIPGPVSAQIGLDPSQLAGTDSAGRVLMYAPSAISLGSSVSHFDISTVPNLLMEPAINPDIGQSPDLTDELLRDIGWYPDVNYNGIPDTSELDLGLALTATPSQLLNVGSAVTLTLTITSSGLIAASAAHIVDSFPSQLGAITWEASYSGGASGPASGSGNIDFTLAMPSGSQATFVIRATVVGQALIITNTASVTSSGEEIDVATANNQATVQLSLVASTTFLPMVMR
ncbi:hypothetical protein EKD04_019790 [Chloroflexales bacterium ZM16-3]|nr:hypothetical protein [Chloroflexales bacterium ZM16-3]